MFLLREKNTPRWVIFCVDVFICFCSLMLAYQLRFNFRVPENEIARWAFAIPTLLITRVVSFFISKIYAGIIRYTSTRDALRIFYTVSAGTVFLALANLISVRIIDIYLV